MDAFLYGLNDQIAIRIYEMFPGPRSLSAIQTIAFRIDNRLATRRQIPNNQNRQNNNNNWNNNNRRPNSGKKNSVSKLEDPCLKKKKKEEKDIFVPIADLSIIPLINALLKIKVNPLQAALMLLIVNKKSLQEEESLINPMWNFQFLNSLLTFQTFLQKQKFFSFAAPNLI